LSEALRDSDKALESLRDPWDHSYYATFNVQPFYSDRVQIENRGKLGEPLVQQTKTTPVTSTATTITIRSAGADGQTGTPDDFTVGSFAGVFIEQAAPDAKTGGGEFTGHILGRERGDLGFGSRSQRRRNRRGHDHRNQIVRLTDLFNYQQ
jgi:hypothetical protein